MKNLSNYFTAAILSLMLGSVLFIGCGDNTDGNGHQSSNDESSASESSDGSDNSGGSISTPEDYYDTFEELVEIVESVESTDDVKAADPKLEKVFKQMAAAIKDHSKDEKWAKMDNDPRMKELSNRMEAHMEHLSKNHMQAAIALSFAMAKHGAEILGALGEAMPEMSGQDMQEMQDAMKDANKALEEMKEKLGN